MRKMRRTVGRTGAHRRGGWRQPGVRGTRPLVRLGTASVLMVLCMLLVGLAATAVAQAPGGDPSATPAASGGVPGATPGTPAVWLEFDVTLPDLLEGVLKMESAGLYLTTEQARAMRPALERERRAFEAMDAAEKVMRRVLSEAQMRVIEEAQSEGTLKVDLGEGRPDKPGEDPLISRVQEILGKKSSKQDGTGNR